MAKGSVQYQFKVVLNHVKPSIWRRIVVPGNLTVRQLHAILQAVMNWSESHLHVFEIQDKEYGDPQDDETGMHAILDEHNYRLDRVIPKQVGFRFTYTYDFGDDWEHVLLVEKVLPQEESAQGPVCLAGKRAGALEDSGGPYGFMELLEILKDPANPENAERQEWAGEYDPEAFDLQDVNRQLAILVESDYEIEALFEDLSDDDLMGSFDDSEPELTLEFFDAFTQAFGKWMLDLPPDLQATCENLRIRKDYIFFLNYLRDHKVKGTATTGNLPIKAVREINAGFIFPQPMEYEGRKLRSEDDVPDLLFLHAMAYARELINGGPAEQWEVTEEGLAFLDLPASIQVLDMFLTWLMHMEWGVIAQLNLPEDEAIKLRKSTIQFIAQLADDEWIELNALIENFAEATGVKVDDTIPEVSKEFFHMMALAQLVMPLLTFELIEGDHTTDLAALKIRRTPLGSNLLNTSLEILKLS